MSSDHVQVFEESFEKISSKLLRHIQEVILELRRLGKRRQSETYQGAFTVLKMAFGEISAACKLQPVGHTLPNDFLKTALTNALSTLEKTINIAGVAVGRSLALKLLQRHLSGVLSAGADLRIILKMALEPDTGQPATPPSDTASWGIWNLSMTGDESSLRDVYPKLSDDLTRVANLRIIVVTIRYEDPCSLQIKVRAADMAAVKLFRKERYPQLKIKHVRKKKPAVEVKPTTPHPPQEF